MNTVSGTVQAPYTSVSSCHDDAADSFLCNPTTSKSVAHLSSGHSHRGNPSHPGRSLLFGLGLQVYQQTDEEEATFHGSARVIS